jgi:hypothetical protein
MVGRQFGHNQKEGVVWKELDRGWGHLHTTTTNLNAVQLPTRAPRRLVGYNGARSSNHCTQVEARLTSGCTALRELHKKLPYKSSHGRGAAEITTMVLTHCERAARTLLKRGHAWSALERSLPREVCKGRPAACG